MCLGNTQEGLPLFRNEALQTLIVPEDNCGSHDGRIPLCFHPVLGTTRKALRKGLMFSSAMLSVAYRQIYLVFEDS